MISLYALAGMGGLAAIAFTILLVGISRARARAAEVAATMERHRRAVAEAIIDADERRRQELKRTQAEHEAARRIYEAEIANGRRDHLGRDW